MKKFYIASSFKNINEVRYVSKMLKDKGFIQTYDWTLNERAASYEALEKIGQEELAAVIDCDLINVILPAGKGSHIELGIALGIGKKIFLYSPNKEVNNLDATSNFLSFTSSKEMLWGIRGFNGCGCTSYINI